MSDDYKTLDDDEDTKTVKVEMHLLPSWQRPHERVCELLDRGRKLIREDVAVIDLNGLAGTDGEQELCAVGMMMEAVTILCGVLGEKRALEVLSCVNQSIVGTFVASGIVKADEVNNMAIDPDKIKETKAAAPTETKPDGVVLH